MNVTALDQIALMSEMMRIQVQHLTEIQEMIDRTALQMTQMASASHLGSNIDVTA